ncbi:Cell number regulator 8 [Camellia lanceoleosa]|uniref:Cell number regulator 8 n=1 Tax=Camellia lanceoleosa TaxID=1840588 RepID=A0ACC0I0Q1_9ERIC|nr:Cell number regulator 8 [Camellia lanceoleosa]
MPAAAAEKHSPPAASGNPNWTADGLPLGHGSVIGEPLRRAQWDSSLFAFLGRNAEFCSSDLEVCGRFCWSPYILGLHLYSPFTGVANIAMIYVFQIIYQDDKKGETAADSSSKKVDLDSEEKE